jgi:hypothetical protein
VCARRHVGKVEPIRRRRAAANTATHPVKRTRSKAEERAVQRLRRICLALPEVTEKVAWGELTWRIGKIFAQMDTHHHGADHVAVWLAVPPGLQEALIQEDPMRFFRPPYVGSKGWVGVRIDSRPDWKMVASVVRDAHEFIASSRLRRQTAPLRGKRAEEAPPEGGM